MLLAPTKEDSSSFHKPACRATERGASGKHTDGNTGRRLERSWGRTWTYEEIPAPGYSCIEWVEQSVPAAVGIEEGQSNRTNLLTGMIYASVIFMAIANMPLY